LDFRTLELFMFLFRRGPLGVGLFLVTLALCGRISPQVRAEDKTTRQLYPKVLKASVYVVYPKGPAKAGKIDYSCGTGWVADLKHRLVVTNYHVVRDNKQVTVFFPAHANGTLITDRQVYLKRVPAGGGIRGKVLARKISADLALVQIDKMPRGAAFLTLARHSVHANEQVYSLGNPTASDKLWRFAPWSVARVGWQTIKTGKDDLHFTMETEVIATEPAEKLAVSGGPGASGGPLVNERGELVGVCQGMAERDRLKYSVFVDVSAVKQFLEAQGFKPRTVLEKPVIVKHKPPVSTLVGDAEKQEQVAKGKLRLAKMLAEEGKLNSARERYQDIIAGFPDTRAAEEARQLLGKIKQ
jgi:hypothetical protein